MERAPDPPPPDGEAMMGEGLRRARAAARATQSVTSPKGGTAVEKHMVPVLAVDEPLTEAQQREVDSWPERVAREKWVAAHADIIDALREGTMVAVPRDWAEVVICGTSWTSCRRVAEPQRLRVAGSFVSSVEECRAVKAQLTATCRAATPTPAPRPVTQPAKEEG